MTFKDFQLISSKIKKTPLPGIDAQFKLAPMMRKKLGKEINVKSRNPKKAAVMALMYPKRNGELVMIFMLRKSYKGMHSNQIGFPGGKVGKVAAGLLHFFIQNQLPVCNYVTNLKKCCFYYLNNFCEN